MPGPIRCLILTSVVIVRLLSGWVWPLTTSPEVAQTAYEIAIVYCWLGDKDSAFCWLEQAEREHAIGFTFVRVDPRLEGLRSDPRFESLLRGIDRTLP